jgi:hypothetical protein
MPFLGEFVEPLISLFDMDSEDMLSCKSGNWWELNPQRGRANNSAVALRSRITKQDFLSLWERTKESRAGEPAINLTNNADAGINPCFPIDTKIIVDENGKENFYSFSNLIEEEITPNVYCLDENNNVVIRKMRDISLTGKNKKVYKIYFEDQIIRATENHEFRLDDNSWKKVSDLKENDKIIELYLMEGESFISSNSITKIEFDCEEDVFCGSVDDFHNFFVCSIKSTYMGKCKNCAEISLKMQFCNLIELNASTIESQEI